MKACEQIEQLIYPYLDGELESRDNRRVEEHLLGCQQCSEILAEQRRFLTMLQHGGSQEQAPEELRLRVIRALNREKPCQCKAGWLANLFGCSRAVFATLATCSLAIALIWGFQSRRDAMPPFLQASVREHLDLLDGRTALTLLTSDSQAVSRWLSEQVGSTYYLPMVDNRQVTLVGGRIDIVNGNKIGLVNYLVQDQPVTLVVAPKTLQTSIETTDYTYVKDRRINFSQADGFNVVSWTVAANNFALVSRLPGQGKQGCMVCHVEGSGLPDLSSFYSPI